VLAGDFNLYAASPEDRQSLERIEAAGFADAVAPFDGSPTYERFGKRERFDRVFVRGLTPAGARVDRDARVADHRPVIVELR
jgi:endonuclease/exonuclease/phosphatase family metal-dependent hydrolase